MNYRFTGWLLLLFLFGITLWGCGQQGSSNSVSDNTPNHTTPWETGIAGVGINMSTQEIIAIIGEPDEIQTFSDNSAWWKYYNVAYFGIGLDGKVSTIQSHYYVNYAFPETNIGHINVKSTSQEVLAAYGSPDEINITPDSSDVAPTDHIYWKDKSVSGDVQMEIMYFKDNTVHSIRITRKATEH